MMQYFVAFFTANGGKKSPVSLAIFTKTHR
jgi:hypothetical protein